MTRLWVLAPLLLAGCLQTEQNVTGYRDSSVPLTVTTRGSVEAMSGEWIVRGAYPDGTAIRSVTLAPRADGLVNVTISQPGCEQTCHILSGTWPAERVGQNRLRLLTDSAEDTELWVIWMDEGVRTAIVATPDGDAAFIVDRKSTGGEDRMQAAREIMEFNGYDITQFVML